MAWTMTTAPSTFKARFCRLHQCAVEEFEERVFRLCLHRRARLFARFARLDRPGFFGWDWDLAYIRAVANVCSSEEAVAEINSFLYYHPPEGPFKSLLRIRISGRRLMGLVKSVFDVQEEAAPRSGNARDESELQGSRSSPA